MVRASCGFGHALFIDLLGFAFAWGSNTYGQLGLGDIFFRSNVTLIDHLASIRTRSMIAFEESSALVTEDGAVHMCGCGLEG